MRIDWFEAKTWVAFPQIPGKQAARAVSHLTDPRTASQGTSQTRRKSGRTLTVVQGESYRPGCPKEITLEPASQKENLPEDLRRWVRRPLEAGVLKAVETAW